MQEGSRKAIIAAFLANLGIAIAKFAGFLITGSASLMAEAIHSVADTGNQGLLILGGKKASKRATPDHPFGYGRERYFWSFIVAMVLFSMGGLFALYEGYQKLRDPHELESPGVAVVILLVAIGLETFSLTTAARETRKVKRAGTSYWRFIRTTKSPELPVVLLEDVGAEIGLAFALTGVLLAWSTGEARFDAMGSIAIGLLLVVIAFVLAREMKALLIGESASREDEETMIAAMESSPNVVRVIHMRTEHLGPDELLVGAKLEFTGTASAEELARAVNDVEARVRRALPAARLLYLEPGLHDPPPPSDPADPPHPATQ